MHEERFDRIDQTLMVLNQRFDGVDSQLVGIHGRLDGVDQRLDAIDQRFDAVDGRLDELRRHMLVLHEQAMAGIAATREYTGPTREEFAELKETIGRRLDPLEAIVRRYMAERPR